jgi:hypothetical protein
MGFNGLKNGISKPGNVERLVLAACMDSFWFCENISFIRKSPYTATSDSGPVISCDADLRPLIDCDLFHCSNSASGRGGAARGVKMLCADHIGAFLPDASLRKTLRESSPCPAS